MDTYVIMRRRAWKGEQEAQDAGARSKREGEMARDIRWIRSYLIAEHDGTLGSVCIYQATTPDAIREHAARAGLPADEIVRVPDTTIIRPDPENATV